MGYMGAGDLWVHPVHQELSLGKENLCGQPVGPGKAEVKVLLCHRAVLGDLEPVTLYWPSLSHATVVRINVEKKTMRASPCFRNII